MTMVRTIATDFQQMRKKRNDDIVSAFLQQKKAAPGVCNADCIRGLALEFEISTSTVRLALKEGGLL